MINTVVKIPDQEVGGGKGHVQGREGHVQGREGQGQGREGQDQEKEDPDLGKETNQGRGQDPIQERGGDQGQKRIHLIDPNMMIKVLLTV